MKISISKSAKNAHKKLIYLLSVHPEIELSVWLARAKLGIKLPNLASLSEIPTQIKSKYDSIVNQKQKYKKFFEIEEKYEELERKTGKTLPKIMEERPEITLDMMTEQEEYDAQLSKQARIILNQHNLPESWIHMMKHYISTGNIHLAVGEELPISIRLEEATRKRTNLGVYSVFLSKRFEGININIPNFVYVEDLLTWIKDNKQTIESLMKILGFKKYYRPRISDEKFKEGINLIEQLKSGKKYRGIAFDKLKEAGEAKHIKDRVVDDESFNLMRERYQFTKKYLSRLSKKSRT